MARSMNTMPRSSTSWPSGTWVERTRRPARNAGSRIIHSAPSTGTSRHAGHKSRNRIVEQPEEIARSLRAADREGEQDRRRTDPLGDELGAARVFVGGIDYAAHAFCWPFGHKLRQVLAAWRNARLRFDGAGFTQAKPIFEIAPALVVGAY